MFLNTVLQVRNTNFKGSEKINQKSQNISFGKKATNNDTFETQALYQIISDTQYLESGLSHKEIIEALKDKSKMERSFFGYKADVAKIITKAKNPELAVKNFNILMNARDKKDNKLDACDITSILSTATKINSKNDEKKAKEYGLCNGLLDGKSITSILASIRRQTIEDLNRINSMGQMRIQHTMINGTRRY